MPLQKNDQNNITEVSDVDARPQVNESHMLKFNFNTESLFEIISQLTQQVNRSNEIVIDLNF